MMFCKLNHLVLQNIICYPCIDEGTP